MSNGKTVLIVEDEKSIVDMCRDSWNFTKNQK